MIPLIKSTFFREYETKRELADFILRSGKLSMGDACLEFEKRFARWQQRKDCVLFHSGSSANLALLQSLLNLRLLKKGDKVGFSAITWATNVMPLIQLGLVPVPVDCSVQTLNVMSGNLKPVIKKEKIKTFFATNVLGFTGDLPEIRRLCRESNVLLFEDNCEALGTRMAGVRSGNFGLASTFSFYVAHHLSTIEGGAACTDHPELAGMLRLVRANGWDRNLDIAGQSKWRKKFRISSEMQAKYTFYDLAFNLRPTEITGFIGLQQLKYIDEIVDRLEKNFLYLKQYIKENPDLLAVEYDHLEKASVFAMPVVCKSPALRKKYVEQFAGGGVEVRPLLSGNIAEQPFFKKYFNLKPALPGARFIDTCAFYFGNNAELTEQELNTIASCLQH